MTVVSSGAGAGRSAAMQGMQHPFRLPSGTSLRFALLIMSTSVAMAAELGSLATTTAYLTLGGGSVDSLTKVLDCASRNFAGAASDPEAFARRCGLSDLGGGGSTVELAAFAALWLGVGITYWFLPVHRLRRRRLRPFRPDAHPGIQDTLTELTALAEPRCAVRFVVDRRDQRPTGLAFGRVGRRYVMLSGGLLRLHDLDPEAFRAIVLHELAHLRNRDVDIAFLTLICHRLFLFAVAVPMAVTAPFALLVSWLLLPSSAVFGTLLIGAQCALAVTVAHSVGAVLRSRELYADARVALWTRGAHSLRRLLAAQHVHERTAPRRRLLRRTHPSAAKRLAALGDTGLLFRFSPWDAFGLALSCSLVYLPVAQWTGDAIGLTDRDSVPRTLVPAVLLGGSVAAGIWRATLGAHLNRTRWAGAHSTGLAVGCGLALGTFGDEEHRTALALRVSDSPAVQVALWLIFAASGYAFVRWNAVTARAWAPVVLAARRPYLPIACCCAAAVALLGIWLGHVRPLGQPGFSLLTMPSPLNLLPTPLDYLGYVFSMAVVLPPPPAVIAVVAATAAVPLAAPFWARLLARGRDDAHTAGARRFLLRSPSAEASAALLAPQRLRPMRALVGGVVFGGAAGFALWTVHVDSALVLPWPIQWLGSVFTLYTVPVAMLLQLAAGFFAARRGAHLDLRALHGVLAVIGAGLLLPFASFLSRDHFACVRWGVSHPACQEDPLSGMVFISTTITAWTAAFALLLLPAWTALLDKVRSPAALPGPRVPWRAPGRPPRPHG
ncbi:M48 family metalloprotease [Streptomyces sp. NPDC088733]|uniref:M48 family metalloprotease n=1 Tax=Streptomyces sp. NPDC088733 TaxID=3365880 RepID=UPI003811876A